ncbi:MAG: cytidine deaminase [Omnitrophica bacterium RBG_13_46_9]|nr:MAG: cytidine deaminase [Omnitrophica bacterium RBG_13_46_9]
MRKRFKADIKKISRPDWDRYFLSISKLISERSTCLRRKVGAVLVKDKRILATGYNGAPSNITHCDETGCLREELSVPPGQRHELCRGLHAEQNALLQAALHGVSVEGAKIYTTVQPCIICAKMLINAGIQEIIITGHYPDRMARDFLKEARVRVRIIKK